MVHAGFCACEIVANAYRSQFLLCLPSANHHASHSHFPYFSSLVHLFLCHSMQSDEKWIREKMGEKRDNLPFSLFLFLFLYKIYILFLVLLFNTFMIFCILLILSFLYFIDNRSRIQLSTIVCAKDYSIQPNNLRVYILSLIHSYFITICIIYGNHKIFKKFGYS